MRLHGLLAVFSIVVCLAEPALASEHAILGARPGYLMSVTEERHWRETEMVLIAEPAPVQSFSRPLVDAKLTREFQGRYEQKFGRTEAERNYNSMSRFTFFEYPTGTTDTVDKYTERQRQFGEYMFRRLAEHHVDQYAKSNPDVRPIYELKDRIANVNVQLRHGYKMRLNYSYSGNYLDIKVDNPYEISSKLTLQMAPGGIGPSRIQDTILTLGYDVTKTVSISSYFEVEDRAARVVGSKRLSSSLASSLTFTSRTLVDPDLPKTSPRQDLILFGLSWTE